jgi:HEPN domain-containing protein
MDKIVAHWVERAEYDLGTAKAMLERGAIYTLAICANKQLKSF